MLIPGLTSERLVVRLVAGHGLAAFSLLVLLLSVFLVAPPYAAHGGTPITSAPPALTNPPPLAQGQSGPGANSTCTTTIEESTAASQDWLVDSPSLGGCPTKIDFPPDYPSLANFTLQLINRDRAQAGLVPVGLSSEPSGQQHADSMAYYGTVGHWDVQGYKPYMRYTLVGGEGYVAENMGLDYCTNSSPESASVTLAPCSTQTVENGVANSEWGMMNNDAACCNNGHRDNILDPAHNLVSIGVAYDMSTGSVYLVEDFEDSLITGGSMQVSGTAVTLQGTTQQDLTGWVGGSSGAEIGVYFDSTPVPISPGDLTYSSSCAQYSELDEPPSCMYLGAYGPGTLAAYVFAPCPGACPQGNSTFAQTWTQSSGAFDIAFSLADVYSTYGPGVYTIYLWPNGDTTEPITSLSAFVSSQGPASTSTSTTIGTAFSSSVTETAAASQSATGTTTVMSIPELPYEPVLVFLVAIVVVAAYALSRPRDMQGAAQSGR
jgi:uncharacterized protein YkwD